MKTIFAVIVIGIMPLFLFSQSSTTDLTISPDSVYFIPGNPGLATVVLSNNTNQPINLLQVQSENTPGFRLWGWKVFSMSVSTPHYIYPGQSIDFTIHYWTVILDKPQTTLLQDSMYVVSSAGTQYVHIFLDPSLISSVQNHSKSGFPVFPNPAKDRITIDLPVEETGQLLEVVDAFGKVTMTRTLTVQKTQLDISSLPSGVYFVRLSGEKSVQVGKFLKQ
ncbi:MAG: T9SS type A sorting domain-containing protein [Bacteroidota bacterium]